MYVLNALEDEEIAGVVNRALTDSRGLAGHYSITEDGMEAIVGLANGDARASLNMLELCAAVASTSGGGNAITLEVVRSAIQQRTVLYDKSGDQHYDLISALHKSVRDSDVDGGLYWLARMLEGGEDPLYLARRIVRMATEDIGLGDPHALPITIAAQQAMHFLGMPEGALALAEAVAYLCLAPKSNSVYVAFGEAMADVKESRNDPVPLHLRNAPTRLMKELSYGQGYKYAHNFEGAVVDQEHLPERLRGRTYFRPTTRGFEGRVQKRKEQEGS